MDSGETQPSLGYETCPTAVQESGPPALTAERILHLGPLAVFGSAFWAVILVALRRPVLGFPPPDSLEGYGLILLLTALTLLAIHRRVGVLKIPVIRLTLLEWAIVLAIILMVAAILWPNRRRSFNPLDQVTICKSNLKNPSDLCERGEGHLLGKLLSAR